MALNIDISDVHEIDFAGRRFRMHSESGSDLVAHQMITGGYEAPLPMLTMAIIARTKGSFLDVGANNGLYSILASITRPGMRVHAFEPFSKVAELFRRNAQLNQLSESVKLSEVALSDRNGESPLYLPDPAHGLIETSCSLESDFKSAEASLLVPVCTLDSLAIEGPISLIKADIEGHEMAFFRGAEKTIASYNPIIFAEMLSAASSHFQEVDAFFKKVDYFKFRLRPSVAVFTKKVFADPKAWNYAFVPRNEIGLFLKCCETHGVEIYSDFTM